MFALLLVACSVVAPERPNVLLIVSDDQAWDDYGFLGHPVARTPNIDRLAAESLAFPRGYVPTSLCRPSLATLLTGLYPHEHGVTGNDPAVPAGGPRAPTHRNRDPAYLGLRRAMNRTLAGVPTVPGLLRDAGYRTLQTGKWWEGDPRDFGFTRAMTHGDLTRGGRHGDRGLSIARDGEPVPDLGPVPAFLDGAGAAGDPWFVWFAPFLPHTPHNPPARLLAKYHPLVESGELTESEAQYYANVERWDEAVGALLAALDERGLRESTLVVYVCDNGWITLPGRNAYAPRSKRSPHEGGVRTPILLSRPGTIAPRTAETPVSSVDIAPTILAACGVPAPAAMTGAVLIEPASVAGRGPVFGEVFAHDQPYPAPPAAGLNWRWVVDGRWKLIAPFAPNMPDEPVELYDLESDPHETRNLAAQQPERVAALRATLDAWWDPTTPVPANE